MSKVTPKVVNVTKEGSTGVYNPKIRVTNSGVPGALITFQNFQGEKGNLDGSIVRLEDDELFTIENNNYIQKIPHHGAYINKKDRACLSFLL